MASILMAVLGFASPALAKTSIVLRGDIAFRTLETADVWNLEPRRNPFADGDFAAILGAMEAHALAVKAAKEEADAKTAALREKAEADRQACLASFQDANSKAAKRKCRPKAVRKVAPTAIRVPAFSLPQSDGHRLDGVHQAILEHKAGPKPAGWEAKVEEIRNEPDFSRKLELADAYVDAGIRYVDRWGRWALAPRAAFSGGGICRDFAVAKFIMLTEAGVPAESLRLVTVTDRGVTRVVRGKVKSDNFHVMLMAKDEAGQVYVLDMLASDIALGGKAWKLSESPQRHRAVEWAGTLGGSMTADRFRGTVEDVGKVWRQLKGLPRWHIVRGGLVDGGKRPRSDGWFRRHASMEPGTNDIVAKPRNLLILDIDKKPTVDGSRFLDDPAKAIRAFLDAYGPPELRGVSFAYDLSSSCGVVKKDADGNVLGDGGDLINCHVEILMDRPVADETLAAWILAANARAKLEHGLDDPFDVRALVTSQPIYTAAPLLVNVESRLDGPAVGVSAGTMAKVGMSGIDVDRVTADMLDLDRRLTEAGLEPPKGFRASVGRARAAEYMRENGIKPEDRAKALKIGVWKSGGISNADFADRLRSTLKLESGGILQPLQNAVGRHIARCRGDVDVDAMVNDIVAAGVALAGSVENAAARNKNLGPAAARSLVETYLINYRMAQSEFPAISDGRNVLVESPALNDDPAEAADVLKALMACMGNPTEIEGTGRRWRLEMDLAGKLCETFTVNAAARALSDGADIPPREATVMCMKAVLEPSLTREQWRRKSELERAGEDVSHIRPFPHVQKARLERLSAWLKTSGAEGWSLNRETGVVAVEWPAGRILTLTAPEKWASGGYNSVSDTDAMPLIVQPTRNVAESAGVWGSPPTDLDHLIHVFRLPSEAADWMKQAEEPVRCISYGGFADLRSREFLAGFAVEQVDRGAKGVIIHASDIHAQGIAAAIAAKGVPVAAPGIDGYPPTLGEGLKDRSLDEIAPASSIEEEIEGFDPDNLFGTETVAEMQARWTGGTALERAKAKGIPM